MQGYLHKFFYRGAVYLINAVISKLLYYFIFLRTIINNKCFECFFWNTALKHYPTPSNSRLCGIL